MNPVSLDVFKVANELVNRALRRHGRDTAIIAHYGSQATGTASVASDLDLFYIPVDGRAESLCSQFVS